MSRTGATTGSSSELSACTPPSVLGRCREQQRLTFGQTDNYTDIGFDTQYQYQGSNYWITLRGSLIHEFQNLNASFTNGLAANPSNTLNEARAYASLAYGNGNRVVLTGQYFTSWGSPDASAVRRQSEHQRLDRRDRLHSVHQQPGAGMAVVQRSASGCNTPITPNSTEPRVGATRQQYSVPLSRGWRCSGSCPMLGTRDETNTARRRRAFAVDRLGVCRRSRTGNAAQGAAGAAAVYVDRLLRAAARPAAAGDKKI